MDCQKKQFYSSLGPTLVKKNILPYKDCLHYASHIVERRKLWTILNGSVVMSLGNPVYRSVKDMSTYYSQAAIFNRVLYQEFGDLYRIVCLYLTDIIGEKVFFHYNISIPGFHIIELKAGDRYCGGCIHRDLSYQSIDWGRNYCDPEIHLSYTLALELPSVESGLQIQDYPSQTNSANQRNFVFVRYHIGDLVVFDGYQPHRISPIDIVKNTERRITLQGHCIKVDEKWITYW